ncbi:tetratricopeptide repeat protein [Janthinobacterium lividum]|uniref:tetratricopeptide repeat protein n=1 Tax=Janthinobacterium lividum TaxID=29581 RepID=UPI000873F73E|nr:tetratricopeptide repeat protein [Janthinobacterium lividum]MCC7712726.1 sel1 repeat family protein [Janthinobacterium lividum]OEZ65828.1 Sel1 repeat protein [Janthinobacterium lividum]WQE31167.1 tetratricopeptide repeat protein [Janthinobacterium lividum]STQ96691.1 Sel1 repeat [Janthinobacterium lividum]
MPKKFLLLIPFLLPLPLLAQTSPTLLDLQLLAIKARADAASHSPESIAEFEQARRAAEAGDVEAQLDLARMLQLGVGTPQDTAQSMAWIRKSAEGGYAPAQSALGVAYTLGGKVPIDRVHGEYWLRKGAAQGNAEAQTILALEFIDGDSSAEEQALAIQWLKKAALEEHFTPAYNALGEHLMRTAADEQDRGEAFHWYDRSAREKEPAGMRNLARAHELGLGVAQSDKWALVWYERAGWSGDVPAMRRMIEVYVKGELGQAANAEDAAEWRGKLAEKEKK